MSNILYAVMILATVAYVIYLGWLVDELDKDNRQLSTRLRLLTFQASQSCTCRAHTYLNVECECWCAHEETNLLPIESEW